jgi:hypothetical protein
MAVYDSSSASEPQRDASQEKMILTLLSFRYRVNLVSRPSCCRLILIYTVAGWFTIHLPTPIHVDLPNHRFANSKEICCTCPASVSPPECRLASVYKRERRWLVENNYNNHIVLKLAIDSIAGHCLFHLVLLGWLNDIYNLNPLLCVHVRWPHLRVELDLRPIHIEPTTERENWAYSAIKSHRGYFSGQIKPSYQRIWCLIMALAGLLLGGGRPTARWVGFSITQLSSVLC